MKIKYQFINAICYVAISVLLVQGQSTYDTVEFWGVLLSALAIQVSTALSMLDDD